MDRCYAVFTWILIQSYLNRLFGTCQSWSMWSARCYWCYTLLLVKQKYTQLKSEKPAIVDLSKFLEQWRLNANENVSRHMALDETFHKSLHKSLLCYDVALNANLDIVFVDFLELYKVPSQELSCLSLDEVLVSESF